MSWILVILLAGAGPGVGTSTLSVPFKTQELCEAAKEEIKKPTFTYISSTCVQVR